MTDADRRLAAELLEELRRLLDRLEVLADRLDTEERTL